MTKAAVMTRAHEIARALTGDYRARMSYGLRQAWLEHRLLQMGGRRWQKAGHDRIYLNNLADLYGLRVTRYGTGNISSATLDGEHISNNSARKILIGLMDAKVWYDCKLGQFEAKGLSETARRRIMRALGQEAA